MMDEDISLAVKKGVDWLDQEDISLAVKKGMYWLDQERPGWVERVDLRQLKMHNSCRCILGQVFKEEYGEYGEDYYDIVARHGAGWAWEQGFSSRDGDWVSLEEGWIEAVQARRGGIS